MEQGVERRNACWTSSTPGRTIPAALKVDDTYLICSEVSYKYVPTVGYVMAKAGITLSDYTYTRPRQSLCVMYSTRRGRLHRAP